jgi:DeoR/GlpR family transcriptional regulator of sugar metabolism
MKDDLVSNKIKSTKLTEPLLPIERQQRIQEILKEGTSMRVAYLSEFLGVSEMTIRRDLDFLEEKGVVERTYGGAVLRQEWTDKEFKYQDSVLENPQLKKRIAQKAAAMINPHDIVFLGEGSTTALVLRYADPTIPFKIFSNNLGAIPEAQDKVSEFVLLGGLYNHASRALAGPTTIEMISQVYATKTFLGADGFSLRTGATTTNSEIAQINRSMIRHSRGKVILMVDYSKFGRVAENVITPVKKLDILITDRKITDGLHQHLKLMGIRVVIA